MGNVKLHYVTDFEKLLSVCPSAFEMQTKTGYPCLVLCQGAPSPEACAIPSDTGSVKYRHGKLVDCGGVPCYECPRCIRTGRRGQYNQCEYVPVNKQSYN